MVLIQYGILFRHFLVEIMKRAFQCITDGLFNGLASKYYHYTSFETCYKILESNDIWMSDIHYLNDTTEILSCKC